MTATRRGRRVAQLETSLPTITIMSIDVASSVAVGDDVTVTTGQRIQQLIDEYAQRTGQYPLSLRRFARQFREVGGRASHQALSKLVTDQTRPRMETLQDLAMFFGTSICAFDTNVAPEQARVMGRLARLDEADQATVAKLIDEMDPDTSGAPHGR